MQLLETLNVNFSLLVEFYLNAVLLASLSRNGVMAVGLTRM